MLATVCEGGDGAPSLVTFVSLVFVHGKFDIS